MYAFVACSSSLGMISLIHVGILPALHCLQPLSVVFTETCSQLKFCIGVYYRRQHLLMVCGRFLEKQKASCVVIYSLSIRMQAGMLTPSRWGC